MGKQVLDNVLAFDGPEKTGLTTKYSQPTIVGDWAFGEPYVARLRLTRSVQIILELRRGEMPFEVRP
jgi:hypothetical protein